MQVIVCLIIVIITALLYR